jgi:hypothetical protein
MPINIIALPSPLSARPRLPLSNSPVPLSLNRYPLLVRALVIPPPFPYSSPESFVDLLVPIIARSDSLTIYPSYILLLQV